MADPYKSALESYNESLRPRRLPTAEEEAVEPVYPEEYLMGGSGKAVASGFTGLGKQTAKNAARPSVKIGSKVPNPEAIAAEKAVSDKFYKTKWGQATYQDLKNKAEQAAKDRAVNKIKGASIQAGEKASTNFFGEAGNAIGNEIYNQNNKNEYVPTLKKGGKVSSASKRGDGCAVRGKTKGRLV
jgi:hypothetical protein